VYYAYRFGARKTRRRTKVVFRELALLGLIYLGIYVPRQLTYGISEYIKILGIVKTIFINFNRLSLALVLVIAVFVACDIVFFYRKSRDTLIRKYTNIGAHILALDILSIIIIDRSMESTEMILIFVMFLTILFWVFILNLDESTDKTKSMHIRDDSPINDVDDLFPERKAELKHIMNYIDNAKSNEAIVISINGRWGEGKTGIINCLKKQYGENDEFKNNIIWVQPMVVDSREGLIKYFFTSLSSIFEENEIYTGNLSYINQYMKLLLEVIGKDPYIIDNINLFKADRLNDYRGYKESLQKEINRLPPEHENKKILVVIDDFDRVDDENKMSILRFIKEIADFKGMIIIFAMDYERVTKDKISYAYLEKFISKRFDLKQLRETSIIEYYLDKGAFLDPKYKNDFLNVEITKLRKNLTDQYESLKEDIVPGVKEYGSTSEAQSMGNIKITDNSIHRNPRRIKKWIREIEDIFFIIDEKIKDIKMDSDQDIDINKLIKTNINKIIVRFAYIKVFFEDEFTKIINYGELNKYLDASPLGGDMDENANKVIIKGIFKYAEQDSFLNISKSDRDVIKFIDDYILNHYSQSYVTEKQVKRKKELRKMILGGNITDDNEKSLLEYTKELIEVVVGDNTLEKKKMFETVFKYIEHNFNEIAEKIHELIYFISIDLIRYSHPKDSYLLIEGLITVLEKNNIVFGSESKKKINISNIEDIEKNIILINGNTIALSILLARHKEIEDISEKYQEIKNRNERISNLESLNTYIMSELHYTIDDKIMNERNKIDLWREKILADIQLNSEIKFIDREYILGELGLYTEALKNIDRIKAIIKKGRVRLVYSYHDNLEKKKAVEIKDILIRVKEELNASSQIVEEKQAAIEYYFKVIKHLWETEEVEENGIQEIISLVEDIYPMVNVEDLLLEDRVRLLYYGLLIPKLKIKCKI